MFLFQGVRYPGSYTIGYTRLEYDMMYMAGTVYI
jgi:hypothetical protein